MDFILFRYTDYEFAEFLLLSNWCSSTIWDWWYWEWTSEGVKIKHLKQLTWHPHDWLVLDSLAVQTKPHWLQISPTLDNIGWVSWHLAHQSQGLCLNLQCRMLKLDCYCLLLLHQSLYTKQIMSLDNFRCKSHLTWFNCKSILYGLTITISSWWGTRFLLLSCMQQEKDHTLSAQLNQSYKQLIQNSGIDIHMCLSQICIWHFLHWYTDIA